jgi:sRNA-binding regulator protein Hfq
MRKTQNRWLEQVIGRKGNLEVCIYIISGESMHGDVEV